MMRTFRSFFMASPLSFLPANLRRPSGSSLSCGVAVLTSFVQVPVPLCVTEGEWVKLIAHFNERRTVMRMEVHRMPAADDRPG